MSFNYTTGLNNMGSFQVSGRPWLKNHSFTGVESKFYEFPNVTDYIKVANGGANNLDIVFCEPRRSANMPDNNEHLSTSITATQEVTLSMWVKFDVLTAGSLNDKRIATLIGTDIDIRVQTRNKDDVRVFINNDGSISTPTTSTSPLVIDQWFNFVFVVKSGDTKVYLNGALLTETVSTQAITSNFNTLTLGSTTSNHDGSYSNIYLFNRALTETEIAKVYNGSYKTSPSSADAIDGLVSWWAFEDNHYKTFFTTPDTTTTIFDRISSNNLAINTGTLTFEDGYQLDNALDRHKITLGAQEEIRLNCKSKQVFLRSTGNVDVNVSAGLTGIPASRMYQLTGPGIDE
jgi:hypothetical protein